MQERIHYKICSHPRRLFASLEIVDPVNLFEPFYPFLAPSDGLSLSSPCACRSWLEENVAREVALTTGGGVKSPQRPPTNQNAALVHTGQQKTEKELSPPNFQ